MKPLLYTESQMERPATAEIAGRRVGVFSARSPDKESCNEDAAAVLPWGERAGVLVVADGLGGGALGEAASRTAVEALRDALAAADPAEAQLRTLILDGIETANRRVMALAGGAATTLAVVEVTRDDKGGDTARTYHVGDAGVLVFGGRGRVKLLTTAHAPVAYGVEAGLLDPEDAMNHEDRHLVSNVVGSPESRIELGPTVRLAPRDTVLLASDGLFDNLTVDEIVELARRGSVEHAAGRLAESAGYRMTSPVEGVPSKPDDLTFILIR